MRCLGCAEDGCFLRLEFPDDSDLCETCIQWKEILQRFPKQLQQEIVEEKYVGDEDDVEELKNWRLLHTEPITIKLADLLLLEFNRNLIRFIPEKQFNIINKKWNLNLPPLIKGVDQVLVGSISSGPGRYTKYWKLPGHTAPPSVMVDGMIYWGVARYIAALGRGDETLRVWSIQN
jgi:hypothetical protein